MAIGSRGKRTPKRFGWLNPEIVLYLAYVLYVSSDKSAEGTKRYDEATKIYEKFSTLDISLDTPDGQYLLQARTMIISYAGAIRRLRQILNDEITAAREEYDDQKNQIARNRIMSSSLSTAKKTGLFIAISGLGYSIAQTFSIFVPQHVADKSGTWAPSIALAILLPLAINWLTMMWRDLRLSFIEKRYSKRIIEAWNLFLKKRLSEYRQHLFDLCEIYTKYSGKRHRVLSSIEAVLTDDLETYKQFVSWRDSVAKSPLHLVMPLVRRSLAWRKRRTVTLAEQGVLGPEPIASEAH